MGWQKSNRNTSLKSYVGQIMRYFFFVLLYLIRFKVFATVTMKITVSCHLTSCNLLYTYQHFGGTIRLHFRSRNLSWEWHKWYECTEKKGQDYDPERTNRSKDKSVRKVWLFKIVLQGRVSVRKNGGVNEHEVNGSQVAILLHTVMNLQVP
jgi:hypothetical protein